MLQAVTWETVSVRTTRTIIIARPVDRAGRSECDRDGMYDARAPRELYACAYACSGRGQHKHVTVHSDHLHHVISGHGVGFQFGVTKALIFDMILMCKYADALVYPVLKGERRL